MHTSMINTLNCMIVLTTDNPLSLLDSHVNEEKKINRAIGLKIFIQQFSSSIFKWPL